MTTKYLTGMRAKRSDANHLSKRTISEHFFQVAYGAIQWPWLLKSLYGGKKAEKRRLLDRLDLDADALPHLGSWKADTYFLNRIVDLIQTHRPATVIELGAGASSLVIAKALRDNGNGRLHSYDQHLPFVEQMEAWLAEHRLHADFEHAPLTQRDPRWPGLWYSLTKLPTSIDLLVIDGPPWAVHPYSRGIAERLFPMISPGGIIMLDDAARPGERHVARRWRRDWPDFEFSYEGEGVKGLLLGRRNEA